MMRRGSEWIGLAVMLGVLGCAAGPPATATRESALDAPAITVDASIYGQGQRIVVSWTNLAGNAHDWVGLAPTGAPLTTVTQWVYTDGASTGTHTFAALSTVGSYAARAFVDDSYTLVAESAAFPVVSSGIVTDLASYIVAQSIEVSWEGLPGNAKDWVAIAPQGSSPQTVSRWVYAGGATAGSHGFEGLYAAGSYVARTFVDDSDTLFNESAVFVIAASGNTAISTERTTYPFKTPAFVQWNGLPGGAKDWVAIAPQGSSAQTVLNWTYTGGRSNGSTTLALPPTPGIFVARAFANDTYVLLGESAPFSIQVPVITADLHALNQPFTVTLGGGLPANGMTFKVVIAPPGSPGSTELLSTLVANTTQYTFDGPLSEGTYVARVTDSITIYGESPPFTVSAQILLTTDHAGYVHGPGRFVHITWINLNPSARDWVGIAPAGSENTNVVNWSYAGISSGTGQFNMPPLAGTYVARAFASDSYTKVGESAPFVVQ